MAQAGESWGRYPPARHGIVTLHDRSAPLPPFEGSALPYGNGRSYGDSCLNDAGTLLHTAGMDRYLAFDPQSGVLDCEAGVSLAQVIETLLPKGWFPAVTPGTRHVTIGGAIANDVHGKNHHLAGSFGAHVLDFDLLRSDGQRLQCSRTAHPDWFAATIGGLGLTGVVTRARLQLRPVAGPWMDSRDQRFSSLQEFFELSARHAGDEYTVAWVDCLAGGRQLGRGIFSSANHSRHAHGPVPDRRKRAVPFTPPISLVNPLSLRVFNQLHYARSPRGPHERVQPLDEFFYPLDAISGWNKLYGPRGLLQYQCVVPPGAAEDSISEILQRVARAGSGSMLAVLKQFGPGNSPGMLSFPRQGTTLALDFPNKGEATMRFLSGLDEVVLAAGGAVYPAKDARMSPRMFAASFPRLAEFREYVDPRFSSGLWRRVVENP